MIVDGGVPLMTESEQGADIVAGWKEIGRFLECLCVADKSGVEFTLLGQDGSLEIQRLGIQGAHQQRRSQEEQCRIILFFIEGGLGGLK